MVYLASLRFAQIFAIAKASDIPIPLCVIATANNIGVNTMSKLFTQFFLVLVILSSVIGCANTGKLMKLQLDMTKEEVIRAMGEPDAARGSMRNKYDQVIEVWEYLLSKTDDDAFHGWKTPYWMYFYNGRLVQWGEAGDWKREADRIYEIRFR